jgi:PAS domain S-box-containing protein
MNLHAAISLLALISYGGLLILVLRHGLRGNRPSQIFSVYLLTMLFVQMCYLMLSLADNAEQARLWYTLIMPLTSGQFIIYLFFTRTMLGLTHSKRLVWFSALIWLLTVGLTTGPSQRAVYSRFHQDNATGLFVPELGPLVSVLAIPILLFLSLAIVDLVRQYRSIRFSLQRARIQYLILGILVVLGGMTANFLPTLRPYPVDVVANVVNAILIAYAILRYQLLDINVVIRKGLLYSIPTAILGAGYFLIIYLATKMFHGLVGPQIFLLSLVVAIVAALAAQPLRDRVQHGIDRAFYREKYDSSVMVQRLSRTATSMLDFGRLTQMILADVTKTMHIQWAAFFLEQDGSGDLRLVAQRGLDVDADLSLTREHPVAHWLSGHEGVLTAKDVDGPQEHARPGEIEELEKAGAERFVPLKARGELIGILAVGPKLSQLGYSQDDELTLTMLANQTAVAIDNARLYEAVQQELAERKRAQEALRKSEEEHRQVVENANEAIIVAQDGTLKFFNPKAVEIAGFSPEELSSMPFVDLVHPDDREMVVERHIKRIRGEQAPGVYTFRMVDKQGDVKWLEVNAVVMDWEGRPATLNFLSDVTERIQAEEALKQYSERLEEMVEERTAELEDQYARVDAILSNTADGIVVTDAAGEIIQVNPVAQGWFAQALSSDEASLLRAAVRRVASQAESQPVELLELTGLDLELSGALISTSEGETAQLFHNQPLVVVAIHDVSHLKALDRMKTRFITNISHELRTPITTVKLYAHLMQRYPEKRKEYLLSLVQEADHLAGLIEEVLQISQIDAGRLEMESRSISLNELAEKSFVDHRALAQERGLTLAYHPAAEDPVALGDPKWLLEALDRLVENGLRFTGEGGEVTIVTGVEEKGGHLWATVTILDTGIGIPEEELPYIFDRFFRGEGPRTMQLTGTGLGLSLVKEIVALHGGEVTVTSPSTRLSAGPGATPGADEKHVGSIFTVWLPLANAETVRMLPQ